MLIGAIIPEDVVALLAILKKNSFILLLIHSHPRHSKLVFEKRGNKTTYMSYNLLYLRLHFINMSCLNKKSNFNFFLLKIESLSEEVRFINSLRVIETPVQMLGSYNI